MYVLLPLACFIIADFSSRMGQGLDTNAFEITGTKKRFFFNAILIFSTIESPGNISFSSIQTPIPSRVRSSANLRTNSLFSEA